MDPVKPFVKLPFRRGQPARPASTRRAGGAAHIETLESTVLAALRAAQHHRQSRPTKKGPSLEVPAESTVRMRPRGGPDRRFVIAYAIDPDDAEAVIFRIRPASSRDLGPMPEQMLSTQEAADRLNVSRPYIVKLVDEGILQRVERTRAGHRRIPAAEIDRIREDMQTSRRASLQRMEAITVDLREKALDDARAASKRRWIKTAG